MEIKRQEEARFRGAKVDPVKRGVLWIWLLVGLCAWMVGALPAPGAGAEPIKASRYAVVVRAETLKDASWKAVADALQTRHAARVVTYPADVQDALLELSAFCPDAVAFLAPPDEAKSAFVWTVHRMMRELDEDPYTDAVWGIVTGYDADDALRIARETTPLRIERGASGTGGGGSLGPFASGFATDEGRARVFFVKAGGQVTEREEKPDCVKALVEGFNELKPQCFVTSGHATHKDWQVGYTYRGGQLRCDKGRLYGLGTAGVRHDLNSPEPKIYLPVGNCLIGGMPEPDCMAAAFIHSGGVRQMFGYTAVTFFGYGGWGIKDIFFGQPGRFTFSEAVYFNNQSLLRELDAKFHRFADLRIPDYDHNRMNRALDFLVARHGINGDVKQALGLLWDRDVVAFYGDPAWEARMPDPPAGLPWTQTFSGTGDRITFTITAVTNGGWPGRPVAAFLPQRLDNVKVVEGEDAKPVVTDNFILVPLSGSFNTGDTVRVVFTGTPLVPDLDGLKDAEAVLKDVPADLSPALRQALGRAGKNRKELVAALREAARSRGKGARAARLKALGFLVAHMPRADLRSVGKDLLMETLDGAMEARDKAPWKAEITDELFLNHVLPYACLDEKREAWRRDFQERFAARAWAKGSAGEAARFLNGTIFHELKVTYHATKRPKPNQSPGESRQAGFASCTGLSILLVDACRACGIPARVVGIPAWKTPNADAQGRHGGNHMWVEVWDRGAWHCLGAIEDSPLDKTWFIGKIREASDARLWPHSVYATSWQRTGLSFPLVWNLADDSVSAQNVTESYPHAP